MFEQDERPIKPDKKYIEQCDSKLKQKTKSQKLFLHKSKLKVLPCQKENLQNDNLKNSRSQSPRKFKSKAETYQQIKRKNRQKFGEWNKFKNQNLNNKQKPKLDPKKMTISYTPKAPNIDTRQYRKPDYKPANKAVNKNPQESEKKEYKVMIQYLKRMYGEFEIEKEKFQQEKEYLKFKKIIQKQRGIQIISKVSTRRNKKIDIGYPGKQSQQDLNMIEAELDENYVGNVKENEDEPIPQNSNKLMKFHYTLQTLHECHPFSLREIYKYTNHRYFVSQEGPLCLLAKNIAQQCRPHPQTQVQSIKPKCEHGSMGVNHSVCPLNKEECLQKRITKFYVENEPNNWFQLWVPGQHRAVYNKATGYKCIWYANGDVKQQINGGKVVIYESKAMRVIQVKVGNHLPFWYFPYIQQFQMKDQKGNKEIIFKDGRHQIIVAQQNS